MNSIDDLAELVPYIESGAMKITKYYDSTNIRANESTNQGVGGTGNSASGVVPHGRKPQKASFNMLNTFSFSGVAGFQGYEKKRTFMGNEYTIEYLPPISCLLDYQQRSAAIRQYVSEIVEEISRIYIKRQNVIPIEPVDSGKSIQPQYLYRLKGGDMSIFEDEMTLVDNANSFRIFLLVDNSCSINDNKKRKMADVLTLFIETIMNHPDKFLYLHAYGQHSTGDSKVTLRQLIDSQVALISDPSKILHIVRSGVNYDPFALLELIESKEHLLGSEKPLVILIGDSWPVTLSGMDNQNDGVKGQSKLVLTHLRKKYKDMLICYISVDKLFAPDDIGFDYFISLKSDDPIRHFVNEFARMIDEIINGKKI